MDSKYIINLIFEQALPKESLEHSAKTLEKVVKSTTLAYEDSKSANDAYKLFNKKGYVEFDTTAGMVSFKLISVELVNLDKYNKNNE